MQKPWGGVAVQKSGNWRNLLESAAWSKRLTMDWCVGGEGAEDLEAPAADAGERLIDAYLLSSKSQ